MFSVIETCYSSRIYCMRKVLWAVLFASQLFSSCRQKVTITEKMAFPQEKRVQAVKFPVGDVMKPSYMIQKGDYLLVRSGQPKKRLFVFTVPEIKGKGPTKFLSLRCWSSRVRIPFMFLDMHTDI